MARQTGPRQRSASGRPFGTLGTAPGANGLIVFQRDCKFDPHAEACSDGNPGLYTARVGTLGSRMITDDDTAADPAFSRSGGLIVFSSARDGDEDIYVMNPDGSDVRQITDDPGRDYEPDFLADGRVVFTSDRDGDADLYAVDVSGGAPVGIGETVGAASTDGRRIAVTLCPRRKGCDIYLYRRDGSRRRLTTAPGADYNPEFSPDGRRIVFISRRTATPSAPGGSPEVFIMRSNGSRERPLTRPQVKFSRLDPSFSPDGRRVLFVNFKSQQSLGDRSDIVVRNLARGSTSHLPAAGGDGFDSAPDWQSAPRG